MAERKQIKLKKTRGGAQQYERSKGDFGRQANDLFYKFMANPSGDPDIAKERRNRPVEKAKGGAVKKYMGGGKVRGYEHGGGVCRGGGAAISGTKFSGVK
jgi:hypothetical protein